LIGNRRVYLVFLIPALGCAVTVIGGWPGGISPDMEATLREAARFRFDGSQSPLLALAWAGPRALLPLAMAVPLAMTIQALAYWLVFALFAYAAVRRGAVVSAVLALLAGFLPPLFTFVPMVESNMQAAIPWALAIAVAYTFRSRRSLLFAVPLLAYGTIARYGLLLASVPLLTACLLLTQPDLRPIRAVAFSTLAAASFATVSYAVTWVLPGSPTREAQLAISRLFDVAGVYQQTHTHCLPVTMSPTRTADAILAAYDPDNVSDLIWSNPQGGFRLPASDRESRLLRQCWLDTVRRHPMEFLRAKVRYASIFLMIGVEWAPAAFPDYSANPRFGLSTPSNAIADATRTYIENSRTTVLWKGWFWLSATGVLVALAVALRLGDSMATLFVYAAVLATVAPHCLFGTAALSRYHFLPILLGSSCVVIVVLGAATRRVARLDAAHIASM
jgi:hypothetical protein